MGKRWTEDDLKKLRPGMVVDESQAKPPGSLPAGDVGADNQAKPVDLNSGKTGLQSMQALGRLPAGKMNKTERRYAAQLELQKAAGDILWWAFEPINLRLGDNCFYRVDFLVLKGDGALECHEVKGHWTDDALVKIRVAAEKFPFKFIAIRWAKQQWEYRHF